MKYAFFCSWNCQLLVSKGETNADDVTYLCAVRAVEEEWEGVVNPNSVTPTNPETNFSRSGLPRDTSSNSMYYIFRQDFSQHSKFNKQLMKVESNFQPQDLQIWVL